MSDSEKVKVDTPDLSWLARLSDKEYDLMKRRYADLLAFNFKQLMKAVMRLELYKDEDFADALSLEVVNELVRDQSLPAELRKKLRAETKTRGKVRAEG